MRRIQDFSGFFDETTLVICGDALIDLDITAAVAEHKTKKAIASVITLEVPRDQVKNYGIVVAKEDGLIGRSRKSQSPKRPARIWPAPASICLNPKCWKWCQRARSSILAASCS